MGLGVKRWVGSSYKFVLIGKFISFLKHLKYTVVRIRNYNTTCVRDVMPWKNIFNK